MIRLAFGALLATVLLAPAKPPPRPPLRPSAPIPSLPVITRVRVDASKDATVVTQELALARGDWQSGDIDAFVAFGGPGLPHAFDVHLLAAAESGPDPVDVGEVVVTERAPRRPAYARALLGRESSAGEVLHLREPSLRRAFAKTGIAAIRIRTLVGPIAPDANGAREVLVRLGTFGATPLTVAKVEVAALDGKPFAAPTEARLCGDAADPYPISVQQLPAQRVVRYPGPAAPYLVVRHPSDDLCIRFSVGA